jgi:alkylation response protein AidB-like acyl-CoA dehydrogenase
MTVQYSPEQVDFRESAIKFARKELNDGAREREKRGEFSMESWKKCAEYGIHGLALPEKYGGLNLDIMSCVLTMEGLGYACQDSGLLFALNSHIWTCEMPILKFGTENQKERYLHSLCDGSIIGGHAITEPDSGSDAFNMRTRAEKKDGRYILNGTKIFISNAPIADVLLVFAVTDKTKGFGGVSAFLVEKGTPGFAIGKSIDKLGLKSSPMSEVVLDDCQVPAENLLGREGAGSAIFNAEMDWERSCLFATHLGAMQYITEETIRYARERKQFGQPIGKFQSVSHKIADMKVRLELSRLVLYKVVSIKAEGKRAHLESSMAKLFISESYVQTCLDALQIHGAYGYTTDFDIERHLRDAIGGKIYSGSSEIQRNIIARFLGL